MKPIHNTGHKNRNGIPFIHTYTPRMCEGKRGWSKQEANIVMSKMGDKDMCVYRCKRCNKFHVGHKPKENI